MSFTPLAPGSHRRSGTAPSPPRAPSRTLACTDESVGEARRMVVRTARDAGLPPDRADDLAVAVSELVTNALDAHRRSGHARPVDLECSVDGGCIEVVLTDAGGGFDPAAIPPRPPIGDPGHLAVERGWGIQIMHALCDLVMFEPAGDGTRARLVMELDADGDAR